MWRVCREAGRPWPVICPEDDYLDYMVMEAVALKIRREEEKERKTAERKRKQQELKEKLKTQFS